jgi:hypothetical protein
VATAPFPHEREGIGPSGDASADALPVVQWLYDVPAMETSPDHACGVPTSNADVAAGFGLALMIVAR